MEKLSVSRLETEVLILEIILDLQAAVELVLAPS